MIGDAWGRWLTRGSLGDRGARLVLKRFLGGSGLQRVARGYLLAVSEGFGPNERGWLRKNTIGAANVSGWRVLDGREQMRGGVAVTAIGM